MSLLIALGLIIGVILIVRPNTRQQRLQRRLHRIEHERTYAEAALDRAIQEYNKRPQTLEYEYPPYADELEWARQRNV